MRRAVAGAAVASFVPCGRRYVTSLNSWQPGFHGLSVELLCVKEGADGGAARRNVGAYGILFNILPRDIAIGSLPEAGQCKIYLDHISPGFRVRAAFRWTTLCEGVGARRCFTEQCWSSCCVLQHCSAQHPHWITPRVSTTQASLRAGRKKSLDGFPVRCLC